MEEFIETWGTKVLKAKPPFSALANVENLVKGSNTKKNIQNKPRQGHFVNNPKKFLGPNLGLLQCCMVVLVAYVAVVLHRAVLSKMRTGLTPRTPNPHHNLLIRTSSRRRWVDGSNSHCRCDRRGFGDGRPHCHDRSCSGRGLRQHGYPSRSTLLLPLTGEPARCPHSWNCRHRPPRRHGPRYREHGHGLWPDRSRSRALHSKRRPGRRSELIADPSAAGPERRCAHRQPLIRLHLRRTGSTWPWHWWAKVRSERRPRHSVMPRRRWIRSFPRW